VTKPAAAIDHLVVARGPRTRIRRKHRHDAPADYAWRRDPELARFDGREPIEDSFSEFLARFEDDLRFENPRERMFAIETSDGEHIGNVMYYGATSGGEAAEIGITIGRKEYHSKGYGREATIVFLRHLWETTPFRTIVLHTLDWNERAIRCFAGAGFEETGRIERHGQTLVQMVARREWWLFHDSQGKHHLPNDSRAAGS